MVSEKKVGDKTVFLCDICGLGYADRQTAQECEDYCRAHQGSCSAEISALCCLLIVKRGVVILLSVR